MKTAGAIFDERNDWAAERDLMGQARQIAAAGLGAPAFRYEG